MMKGFPLLAQVHALWLAFSVASWHSHHTAVIGDCHPLPLLS
jgi:hypothetical protein